MISREENCVMCVRPPQVTTTKWNRKKKNKINATNMKEITKGGRGKGKKLKENKEKNVPWLKSA